MSEQLHVSAAISPTKAYNIGRLQGEALALLRCWTPNRSSMELANIAAKLSAIEREMNG